MIHVDLLLTFPIVVVVVGLEIRKVPDTFHTFSYYYADYIGVKIIYHSPVYLESVATGQYFDAKDAPVTTDFFVGCHQGEGEK